MGKLTSVIPVASTIEDLLNLNRNISEAVRRDIRVIIVLDQISADPNAQLEKLLSTFALGEGTVQILRGKFGSPGKARNEGLVFVKTEFVTFWDADDLVNVENVELIMREHSRDYDYIVGSYQVSDLTSKANHMMIANGLFPFLRIIREPGIWRFVFRVDSVQNCKFGASFMGEDQAFLANSGLFVSPRVFFSEAVFYVYFTGIKGQLTAKRELNSALRESSAEIFRSINLSDQKGSIYKVLIVLRLQLTLFKRFIVGRK